MWVYFPGPTLIVILIPVHAWTRLFLSQSSIWTILLSTKEAWSPAHTAARNIGASKHPVVSLRWADEGMIVGAVRSIVTTQEGNIVSPVVGREKTDIKQTATSKKSVPGSLWNHILLVLHPRSLENDRIFGASNMQENSCWFYVFFFKIRKHWKCSDSGLLIVRYGGGEPKQRVPESCISSTQQIHKVCLCIFSVVLQSYIFFKVY